uniref:Uncharacterized protein n=1 Tax=Hyaloperonospora arabidopsidis (strain Emoy2) TaxID=559515 RepID=M4BC90_HYAAE
MLTARRSQLGIATASWLKRRCTVRFLWEITTSVVARSFVASAPCLKKRDCPSRFGTSFLWHCAQSTRLAKNAQFASFITA